MNLLITSAERLRALYGRAGAQRVLAAIEQLAAARVARGVPSRLLAIEHGAPDLAVPPALVTPEAIARQVAAAAAALGRRGEPLASVLLIGGPEIVPFYPATNPTPYDGDITVPSDCYYGAASPYALPDWAVGRLPGAAGPDPALLLRLLENAAGFGALRPFDKVFGYATAVWARAAAAVYADVAPAERLLISPPELAATFDRTALDGARLIYCNLHGVPEGPPWYGQSSAQPALVAALRPSDLAGLDLRGAIVVSEACYGAAIAGRDADSALALAFLAQGAAAFVGATAISYGPTAPPPGEADLIALHFLRALKQPGTSLGAAFMAARAGMLRDAMARQSTLDEDDQKTLLEFVLYGDPTLVVV